MIQALPHSIKFSVETQTFPTNVRILINGDEVLDREYAPGVRHVEDLRFSKDYQDRSANDIRFQWTKVGHKEDGDKDLHIGHIMINDQFIDTHNYEYSPVINEDWWSGLTADERKKFEHVIHGSASTNFGWHGEIDYNFVSVLDHRSKQLYNTSNNDVMALLGHSTCWVYADRSLINPKLSLYRSKK